MRGDFPVADNYRGASPEKKSNKRNVNNANAGKKAAERKSSAKTRRSNARVIRLADKNAEAAVSMQDLVPDDIVFAMDIGTRNIAGVIGMQEGDVFHVIATEISEHKSRAMVDGQIHDIDQAAATALEVKQKLESRLGIKLKRVAIAAAGRVLRTCQVKVEKSLEQDIEIDADFVSSLEIEGIQRAQMTLDEGSEKEDKTQYYCVGYSVINYYLNGYVMTKLTGHKGKSAGVELLATFLPLTVVDSLYSVVNRIGLEVSSLTLEPIAAINATIPQDLRLLNLALVDIGAGTSDIALTKDGSVFAYAMASIAGDEITERISQQYLVDFATGEKIKTSLATGKDRIRFTDILKKKHEIAASEILRDIEDTIRQLASTISGKILEFNRKSPNAVFLVGGGSRIPLLPQILAEQLGLPEDRVAVRGRDVIKGVRFSDRKLYGPESVTPFGIAVTAQMNAGKDFLSVTVNDKKVKLFNAKKLTISDALVLYGLDAEDLIGRSGKGITCTVNGEVRRFRGELGKAAEIWLNGKPASLDTALSFGDNITVIPAQNGRNASVKASELVPDHSNSSVILNGNPVDTSAVILVNGVQASGETDIKDGDVVQFSRIRTLGELLEAAGFMGVDCDIAVNGSKNHDYDYLLMNGDIITCVERKSDEYQDITSSSTVPGIEAVEDTDLLPSTDEWFDVTVNGRTVSLKKSQTRHMFVDIFNYIEFDLSKPQGTIELRLNGRPAAFTDVINEGDNIEIYWGK
ncbi:MAG TPA: cell division FtsA domain-containing protein [Clostridiales bacterium]|nr:cell division FtsA domain-containing protein [Clostridiales bacterium]